MVWLKIDDSFLEDDTVVELSDRAYRLHVSGMVYCSRNLTNGVVTTRGLRVVTSILGFQTKRFVAELIEVGLWISCPDEGHYEIKNFLKYNPTAVQVKESRDRNAERQRRHRNGESNAVTDAVTNTVSNAAPAQPVPSRTSSKAFGAVESIEEGLWKRLLVATGARDRRSVDKLVRTVAANCCGNGAVSAAITAATGPGVRDPLAVALSELKKRRAA